MKASRVSELATTFPRLSIDHLHANQGEAIHRCLAAGLLHCPQFTKEDSLACMCILDGIEAALRSQPSLPPSPLPQFQGQLQKPPSAVANGLAPETPLDIKMGLTLAEDVSHPLRWSVLHISRSYKFYESEPLSFHCTGVS